jgi:hypothetical protein
MMGQHGGNQDRLFLFGVNYPGQRIASDLIVTVLPQ